MGHRPAAVPLPSHDLIVLDNHSHSHSIHGMQVAGYAVYVSGVLGVRINDEKDILPWLYFQGIWLHSILPLEVVELWSRRKLFNMISCFVGYFLAEGPGRFPI